MDHSTPAISAARRAARQESKSMTASRSGYRVKAARATAARTWPWVNTFACFVAMSPNSRS